jgi:hypothetical protein
MRKATGYKEMLRDRLPQVVDYALKWQKAKERWIDHAYRNFIRLYCDNNERYHTTRIILGIAKYYRNFEFDKSIDWDNLMPEETAYWRRVSSWVRWFRTQYAYMENMYDISLKSGKSEFDIKVELINRYLSSLLPTPDMTEEEKQAKYTYVDKLVDYLIKCFRKSI